MSFVSMASICIYVHAISCTVMLDFYIVKHCNDQTLVREQFKTKCMKYMNNTKIYAKYIIFLRIFPNYMKNTSNISGVGGLQ